MIKDKTFFFATWERTRQLVEQCRRVDGADAHQSSGRFLGSAHRRAGLLIPIYDPVTHEPFPGNIIPADRLDPVALNALGYYPRRTAQAPSPTPTTTSATPTRDSTATSLSRASTTR